MLTKVGAFVCLKGFKERRGEVCSVVVRAGVYYIHITTNFTLVQINNEFTRLWSSRYNLLYSWKTRITQTQGELCLIPCIIKVIKRCQLVKPRTMILLTTITLWFGARNALDDRSVFQMDLKQRFVVGVNQRRRDDVQKARVTLKASCPYVGRSWCCDKPACSIVKSCTLSNPVGSCVSLTCATTSKHKHGIIIAVFWFSLMIKSGELPTNSPKGKIKLIFWPVFVLQCKNS